MKYLVLFLMCLSASAQTSFRSNQKTIFLANKITVFTNAPSGGGGPTPVGWWKFNDASGTTAADSSGNGNNGTLAGTNPGLPTWGTGPNANGDIVFASTSVDQYCDFGSSATLRPTAAGTFMCWILPNAAVGSFQCFMGNGNFSSDLNGVNLFTTSSGGIITAEICNASTRNTINGTTAMTPGTWYHAAVTWDGTTIHVYRNGVEDSSGGTGISQTVTPTWAFPLCVGSDGQHNGQYKSSVDDARVYNSALTAAQILTIFNAGAQ